MDKNTAEVSSAIQGTPDNPKKLTKRELLELADYLYCRYEASKKCLNKDTEQPIIDKNKGHQL